jgi:penicillin amidase
MKIRSIAAACLMSVMAPIAAHAALPAAEKLAAPGLTEPVQILKDKWGISHIYAKNENDLFFAQGYNAARDRLFQFELFRRRANGSLAEVLGPKEFTRDLGARQFLFRGDMDKELATYHPHGRAIIESFVKGVNAYIDQAMKNPAKLPVEFAMLGIKPQHWTVDTAISRINSVSLGKPNSQMSMALSVRAIGAEKVKDLQYFQPSNPDMTMDPIIDTSLLNKGILASYDAWISSVKVTPDEVQPAYRGNAKASEEVARHLTQLALADEAALPESGMGTTDPHEDRGSNNWLVSGKLTMSGFPIVAGDPHRAQESPNLRYWVHLNAPGWNVIGAGEAQQPGISIGHNDYGAWELTAFGTVDEDIYVYRTNPANPNQYKYKGNWEDMKIVNETIAVKGEAPRKVTLKFTRHGPVISEDAAHHAAYGIHASYLEPGGAPYMSSLRMDQAKTWDEYRDAISYTYYPAENYIWGDKAGHIGYTASGHAPLRANSSALLPVPGDGRYDWDGYLPMKDLPHILDPQKGFYATSNDYQVPTGDLATSWPDMRAMHYDWTDPFRAQVEDEVLSSGKRFSVADMVALQNNNSSIPARMLVPLLRDISIGNRGSAEAAKRLLHWDFVLDKDSVEAGIYEMFQRHLAENFKATVVPQGARASLTVPMARLIQMVNAPDGSFGADPLAGRNAMLVKSLDQAVDDLTKQFGADQAKWNLGAYHFARILHPLGGAVNAEWEDKLDIGHIPRGGDAYTVTATGSTDNQAGGGSFKNVFDTENWDNSVGLDNPGQSGDPADKHYKDLYPLWATGRYFPVFFSRPKVESVAESNLTLSPN